MVQSGTPVTSFSHTILTGEPWIIDSGASDHMTGNKSLFSSFENYVSGRFVKITDGSSTAVVMVGTIILGPKLHLSHVLFVPGLAYNLLSINKLTKDL